jgi:[glutamine synthetase] adenylyltransferase / [glutamine synthetase]-adenylyl-L-tyrosine phosphorylase
MTNKNLHSSLCDLYWQRLRESADPVVLQEIESLLKNNEHQDQLTTCWVGSEFAAELCIKHPHWLQQLLIDNQLHEEKNLLAYDNALQQQLAAINSDEELLRALRLFRNQAMLRIIWRDFNRIANTQQTITELSYLAEVCIQQALGFLHKKMTAVYGKPENEKGEEQGLLVLAMGKLGAHELNLSSDIDLIFAYPEDGETNDGVTDNASNSISNHQFFIKLGQKLIQTLDQMTADGFVFRVDMALRPYGESGALACSFDALENYYQEQGRSWERYAMIKARVVAGNTGHGEALMKMLRPFTYRRYIDFSVIESLRDMKALITREVKRKGYQDNIKLGAGGIREIEFIAQAFQLIRGGRDIDFQQRELLKILPLLAQKQLLPEGTVNELTHAYLFLRDTEHALQGFQDKQTQQLPNLAIDQARTAYIMGFNIWSSFYTALQTHRDAVDRHFKFIAAFEDSDDAEKNKKTAAEKIEWAMAIWECKNEADQLALAPEKIKPAIPALFQLQQSKVVIALAPDSHQRLNDFMARLLQESLSTPVPAETLLRIFPFVYAVLRRSAYLVLLNENPQALKQLALLSAASPWIADEIATHPVLLDELLDERSLYELPDREKFASALRQEVLRIPLDDLEGHMEALRYFKQAHRLRVAACEVTERLPLMKVSDYLTFLAEVILNHALTIAWHTMTARHGMPTRADGTVCDPSFIIIGYGKLGGLELGHNSDLDVVFVHGADPQGETNGAHAIDNTTFYMRLAQRIIHILETRTHSGQLYEIDTQLRPSGSSGLLVSNWEAFEKYQRDSAWTWEHQALVRTRVVAGCPELAKQFELLRTEILSRPRELAALKTDVTGMRQKMLQHLSAGSNKTFDLKQDKGGIIDIEFMVQYAVLAWANRYPQLLRWPDNIRILEELAGAELLSNADAQQLIETYKTLRCAAHRLALQQQSSRIEETKFQEERSFVIGIWKKLLG